ncbi:MAG: FLAP-like endonuclease XPG [Hyperionvirus sp.]|uniref:FLAP-like endonuclease XPG n=1 Tax=Hyperionvirus sp. TaxID=2487770 RepID=A0A3G5A903_9VIRU|nr:MAG: FLAP-like endonuclease XPG [Hyperionvirus sp.]
MGGKNVCTLYKSCIKRKHCNEMKGSLYVVDLLYQLHRIARGIKNRDRNDAKKIHDYIDLSLVDPEKKKPLDELIDIEDKVAHLIAISSFVESTIEKCIFPICVLDGKAPELKRRKLEERKRNRIRAQEEKSKIADKTSPEYVKQSKKCVEIRDSHYRDTNELLSAMGLITVHSPGEADSQCAAIALGLPDIAGVITDDSDVLIFGGPRIVKNFNRKSSTIDEIKLSDILEFLKNKANQILAENGRPLITKFKRRDFVTYQILQGTDYNEPINLDNVILDNKAKESKILRFIKNSKASKYFAGAFRSTHGSKKDGPDPHKLFELLVLNDFSMSKLFDQLSLRGTDFESECQEAHTYYLNADVIDPETIDRTVTLPNLEKMIDILHKRNHFNIKFVNKLFNGLLHMYNLFYKIPFGSDWYNSFRSYQIRFQQNKLYGKKKLSAYTSQGSGAIDPGD